MDIRATAEPWDDARLVAALTARAALAPSPADVVAPTIERIRGDVARPSLWNVLRPAVGVAAILLVALIVGTTLPADRLSTPTIVPAASSASPRASTSIQSRSPRPGETFGLPIITVADAILVRDAGVDDRELAVAGWFTPIPDAVYACPLMRGPIVGPVQLVCPDQFLWLAQDPEVLADAAAPSFKSPVGPAIHPAFDQIDRSVLPGLPNLRSCGTRASCPIAPTRLVVIGHFDDRRAALCAAEAGQQCRDRFVVDRVDSVAGIEQLPSLLDAAAGDQLWTVYDVKRLDAAGGAIVSMEVIAGETLFRIEPSLATEQHWTRLRAVWVVRRLVDDRVTTQVIADGSEDILTIRPDGTTAFVQPGLPASHDTPWPPIESRLIAQPLGSTTERLVVALVDTTGHLVEARLAPGEGLPPRDLTLRQLWVDEISKRTLLIQWGGGRCDERLILTIAPDTSGRPGEIILGGRQPGTCRSALVRWAIELRFDVDVTGEPSTRYGINGVTGSN
jgi:hypothetical protein